jgi:CRP/FNR family transcriptional regulator, anaerobic regulatory protein
VPQLPSDDGTELQFCTICPFSRSCLAEGVDKQDLRELQVLVDHVGPLPAGSLIFEQGAPFDAIAAVRSGTVKTARLDREGREHVLGFHLPGEVIGLSGIADERYPCNAVAIDSVQLCRFSFPKLSVLARRLPGLQKRLFRLLSSDIGSATLLSGEYTADERLAAFLVLLSRRLASRGSPENQLSLAMPRTDIANYLGLAPETISRVLRRFQDERMVRVYRRRLELTNPRRLETIGAAILRA